MPCRKTNGRYFVRSYPRRSENLLSMSVDQYWEVALSSSESSNMLPATALSASTFCVPIWLSPTYVAAFRMLSRSKRLATPLLVAAVVPKPAVVYRDQNEKTIQSPLGAVQSSVGFAVSLPTTRLVRSTSEAGSRTVELVGGVPARVTAGPGVTTRAAVTATS